MKKTLLALTLSVLAAVPAMAARGPADVVSAFYQLRVEKGNKGAPTGMELADYSTYLAPELVCRLGASLRYTDQLGKAVPDAKLPFTDRDLYSNQTEGPKRFKLGAAEVGGQSGSIRVHLFRDETDNATWEDTVHVRMQRRHWVIQDIEYGDGSGSLIKTLDATLAHPDAASHWDSRELEACNVGQKSEQTSSRHGKAGKGKHAKAGKGKAGKGRAAAHSSRSAKSGAKSSHRSKTKAGSKTSASKTTKKHKR
ncbi:DUF3828 domain-containing protein [Uliginosibacterium gangwonense]|uniref:DUF3828 domain-containing protein n=1 Tax=Uliginosibacterium gangwonense TaxID=392736 RepID=UPI00036ADD37|nr:DUF3828 domain-containing protein [Uliginosibacterium gangwonense]